MEQCRKNLPIGIDSFEKVRKDDFYYVDKTGLISDLLHNWSEVTLFTRPRRFGKSLNMSMLEAFFSPESDKSIFDGLRIAAEETLCAEYMGRYPVIAISLKTVEGSSYETAFRQMIRIINRTALKVYRQVMGSDSLLPEDWESLSILRKRSMEEADLFESLLTLSEILERYYGRKVVILIDEYDVPLAKAYEHGYYDEMILMIRSLFQHALKTNCSLKFAVLTGCMRISRESIFTGLNNLRVLSIADERSEEYYGFTKPEVEEILAYYGLSDRCEEVREWYDGYRFGTVNVYCPWDVVNYCDTARFNTQSFPENYWINSSGNGVLRRFIDCSSQAAVRSEIEALINGETVVKTIRQELTYQDMYDSIDNLWSVLFTTGYLTQRERLDESRFRLAIPNREVRNIYAEQVLKLFREEVEKDGETLERICRALQEKDVPEVERCLSEYLRTTISVRDTAVRRTLKENFYHGILLGILSVKAGWSVTSNEESGDGYSDIIVRLNNYEMAMIIEIKYAEDGALDTVCRKALQQIEDRSYTDRLHDEGFEHILKYGIAFYKKKCRVLPGEEK